MTEVNDVRALFKHWRKLGWADNGRAPVYETIADLIAELDRTRAELARVTAERDMFAAECEIERRLVHAVHAARVAAEVHND